MDLLSFEDFKNTKLDPKWSSFDYLLEVTRVGQEKLQKPSRKIRKGENKSHDFGYLSFMQKKSSTNNGVLKRKRQSKEEENGGRNRPIGLYPPPLLPESFKQHIVEKMGGSDWVLVIQKQLFFSDVNPQASRFLIPFSQLKTHEFLYESEAKQLKKKEAIKACLLEPSMAETDVSFNRWDMQKSSMYVITTSWNYVVKNNGLEVDDVVQLWSFRVNSTLCFVLRQV